MGYMIERVVFKKHSRNISEQILFSVLLVASLVLSPVSSGQATTCISQNTMDFIPAGYNLISVDSSYQHLVYEIADVTASPQTFSTYYIDLGPDATPGTADDTAPFLLFTQTRSAKPKVNFLGLVAFESQYIGPSMGVAHDATLAVCYWSICPSQIYFAVQTIRRNAPGLFGSLSEADGSFGGFDWNFYELVFARRTINLQTAGVNSPAGVLMGYDFIGNTDLIYNITPQQNSSVYRIQSQDDYGNITTANLSIAGFLNMTFSYYFFDKATGQMSLIDSTNDNKGFDSMAVYQVDANSKILFRGVPESSGSNIDIVFEHTNTGLFSANGQVSQRHPFPVQNDGRIQEWPFLVQNIMNQGHTVGVYSRGNTLDRSLTLYDFNPQTLQFSRPRTWGPASSRANHYFNGWVYGDAFVQNPATGQSQKALVAADCR